MLTQPDRPDSPFYQAADADNDRANHPHRESIRFRRQAALVSLVAGTIICVIKFVAYFLTDSAAIFSDAVESIVNIAAAAFATYAVYQSSLAPDREHPFGRGRWEYFSAGFEGGLIVLAAGAILYKVVPLLWHAPAPRELDAGLGLLAAAAALNAVLAYFLIRQGKRHSSAALVADGKHVLSDVLTSAGVLAGLFAVRLTGLAILDPLVACAMAFWILFQGLRIMRDSLHHLIDRVRPSTIQAVTTACTRVREPAMILPHRLRVRESGPGLEIDFHMIVPRFFTIEKLHAFETGIAARLEQELGRPLDLLMHSDPCEPQHCVLCSMPRCRVRSKKQRESLEWTTAFLLRPDEEVSHRDRR